MAVLPTTCRELMGAAAFFDAVRERFCEAAASGASARAYRIGDRPVLLLFASEELEAILTPALEHLAVDLVLAEPPSLKVFLFDTAATGVAPPPPEWEADSYGVRGEIAGYNTERIRTVYQPGSDVLLLFDRERREAIYWTAKAANVPYWESSFPLRTIFHWWLEEWDDQPVHGAAVGLESGGVLIAGPSGSGKSTTSLACLDGPLRYAGDDYVLVRHTPPCVYSLYGTAKVEGSNLERFPQLAGLVSNPGRAADEKALIYVNRAAPERMISGFPLRAILVPRVTGRRDTALRQTGAGEAFRALAPTTLFQLPGGGRRAFDKMSALVRRVPVYLLEAGTDLPQIPAAITALLESR